MEVKVAPERTQNNVIEVSWNNLTYTVKQNNSFLNRSNNESNTKKEKFRTILKGVSGSFRSGQLTAVMGPSGAGKSSLLECVCGKRSKGLSGDIHISGADTIKVGFVEQFDHLLEHLTVKESLIFASRLRNASRFDVNHETIAMSLITKLGLEICTETQAIGCSGGQRKRLSIALELVSKANILVLDEPTSGLDSSATSQTVNAMVSLTKQRKPMAVVATIHQPSATVFNLFDNVLVMSNTGNCIFQGSPSELMPTLSLIGLNIPNFYNPADYVVEVASGDWGKQSIHLLTHYNKEYNRTKYSNISTVDNKPLEQAIKKNKSDTSRPTLKHIWILFVRTFLTTIREPQLSLLRVGTIFPTAFLIGLIFNSSVGHASGCPPSKLMLWKLDVNDLISKFEEERHALQENLALLFMIVMMSMFISMSPTILTFPLEMNVFRKEHQNSYYSVFAYYVAKVVADLPFCFITSIFFTTIIYFMTGQVFDSWSRFLYVIGINLLVTLSGQSIGMIFGALFMENPNAATFMSGIVVMPLFIFAGFFKKLSLLPSYLVPISYVSFLRYALSAMLITVFGVGRCPYEHGLIEAELDFTNLTRPQWLSSMSVIFSYQALMDNSDKEQVERDPEENLMIMFGGKETVGNNSDKSLILAQFEINDSEESLWHEISYLIIFVTIMHILIYITLVWKVGRKT